MKHVPMKLKKNLSNEKVLGHNNEALRHRLRAEC